MSTKHLLLIGGAALVVYALYSRQQGGANLPAQVSGAPGSNVTSSAVAHTAPLISGTDGVIQGMESAGYNDGRITASPSALTNLVPGTPGTEPTTSPTMRPVMWGGNTGAAHPLEFM